MVGDQVLHRFFVNSRLGEIRSDECTVFSDGRRSEGCARDEFHTYVSVSSVLCSFLMSFYTYASVSSVLCLFLVYCRQFS